MSNRVILVDEKDVPVGEEEKVKAHLDGRLHRAFSVFVFHPDGRWLLQKRALVKYHSGGLWANTCCSHPGPGEETAQVAQRRLEEEMGFGCPLEEVFSFVYRASFPNGLTEHEFDHVFVGEATGPVRPDPDEVEDWGWLKQAEVFKRVADKPEEFTAWFKKIYQRV
ncbi:isopentenyl-diphosphate Delta-isomerase, partial [Patescibacteria group bacterium]|nr:isopentenyl-diphosphate Delta-isomerase [Patescibacteria group bacterium]